MKRLAVLILVAAAFVLAGWGPIITTGAGQQADEGSPPPSESHNGTSTNTFTKNGVTFTFAQNYLIGTYTTDGMPWVVDEGSGVEIDSMTPAYASGRNGFEINSEVGELGPGEAISNPSGECICKNGLCTNESPPDACTAGSGNRCEVNHFDSRLLNGNAVWCPPVRSEDATFFAGESIVKTISASEVGDCYNGSGGALARTCLETAVVLTVVSTAPNTDEFRPPYVGTEKPRFTFSSVDLATKGPNPPLADLTTNQTSLDDALAVFGDDGPWLWHGRGGQWGRHHPRLSVRTPGGGSDAAYGCDTGQSINTAMLRAAQAGDATKRLNLAKKAVQVGIDWYYSAKIGKSFNEQGCIHVGPKPAALFAGHMLSPQAGASEFFNWNYGSHEDYQSRSGAYESVWGNDGTCVDAANIVGRKNITVYACDLLRDGGHSMYGTGSVGKDNIQKTIAELRLLGEYSWGHYQRMESFSGGVAVARIYGFADQWGHDPLFGLVDRYMTYDWFNNHSGNAEPYLSEMMLRYGNPR